MEKEGELMDWIGLLWLKKNKLVVYVTFLC